MKALNQILKDIEHLLRKYGLDGHAEVVGAVTKHLIEKQDLQAFANLEWWGGSGSIADFVLTREHWRRDRPKEELDEEKQDNHALRRALIEIYEHMVMRRVDFPRADSWVSTFKKWENSGI